MIKHIAKVALIGLIIPFLAAGCQSVDETRRPVADQSMTQVQAETFFRQWLSMVDANAPVEDYLKYLPDGEFEQWSYTNADIKDIEGLRAYFAISFAAIKENQNTIKNLTSKTVDDGRIKMVAQVDWTAITAADETVSIPLVYTVTVGRGASNNDPRGDYPKIYRYMIRRDSQMISTQ